MKKITLVLCALCAPQSSQCAGAGMGAERPRIALVYSSAQARKLPGEDALENYSRAVRESGGEVVALSPLLPREKTVELLSGVGGLLLPGGKDVDPALYGQKAQAALEEVDRELDDYEFSVLSAAYALGLPVLAICRGMQVVNVHGGGTLYQDLPSQARSAVAHRLRRDGVSQRCVHRVGALRGTLAEKLLGGPSAEVNSYHHQAVDRPAGGFVVSAISEDGVAEAMERGRVLAVQFHPEKEFAQSARYRAFFGWLCESARKGPVGVKVCGINDEASALAALSAAKRSAAPYFALGLLAGTTHFSREKVSERRAAELARYIRATAFSLGVRARLVCVTHLRSFEELKKLLDGVSALALDGPGGLRELARSAGTGGDALARHPVFDIVQIHDDMPLEDIRRVREAFPGLKIMKAFHVPASASGREREELSARAVELARQDCVDALLLDSYNPSSDQIGGTGIVNDWGAAREIIAAVHSACGKPVALAGGINPANARAALAQTGADLLDANTGYRFDRPGGGWKRLNEGVSAPKDAFAVFSVLEQSAEFGSGYAVRLFGRD